MSRLAERRLNRSPNLKLKSKPKLSWKWLPARVKPVADGDITDDESENPAGCPERRRGCRSPKVASPNRRLRASLLRHRPQKKRVSNSDEITEDEFEALLDQLHGNEVPMLASGAKRPRQPAAKAENPKRRSLGQKKPWLRKRAGNRLEMKIN